MRRRALSAWALTLASGTAAVTALVVAIDRPSAASRGTTRPAAATAPAHPAAHAAPSQGVYLSVVRQRRLGGGPGPVQIEPTELIRVRTPAPHPSPLYVGGRPGLVRVVRGAMSHEVVSRHVVRRPRAGHLVRPGAVALTFDDGPAPGWTPRLLRLLARHHAPATFCVIGREATAHPRLVRSIARHGNALCDHTWDHDVDLSRRSAGRMTADIRRGERAIRRAGPGITARFFRAPGGRWSPALTRAVRAQGLTPLRWTVDPRDWTRPGLPAILRTVSAELRPGGVILLHDGGGNRSQTLHAVRILLHKLRKQGYRFVLPPSR